MISTLGAVTSTVKLITSVFVIIAMFVDRTELNCMNASSQLSRYERYLQSSRRCDLRLNRCHSRQGIVYCALISGVFEFSLLSRGYVSLNSGPLRSTVKLNLEPCYWHQPRRQPLSSRVVAFNQISLRSMT